MALPPSSKGSVSKKRARSSNASSRQRVRASTAEELFAPSELTETDASQESPLHRSFFDDEHRDEYNDSAKTLPKSLFKFFIGLLLLPIAWILTQTFVQAFTTSLKHGLLASQSFGCFAAGGVLFGIFFLIIPQRILMLPYVLGHEVTHALWVWIFGGKVADHFHVSLEGGHVLTDRVNTWIILSPYFFPIYSVLVVTIYAATSLVADLSSYRWLLFLLIGITLAFHLVFTCLLIVKGQPDLHYGGTFFSLMVIYLINLLVIMGLLLATSRIVTLQTFGRLLFENTIDFVETTHALAEWAIAWIGDLWTSSIK